MSDRKAQFRKAQQKRREKLKAAGCKPLTVELSAGAHARLKALSITLFDSPSQPSKVIEHMLTSSTVEPIAETQEIPVVKAVPRPKPKGRRAAATKAQKMTLSTKGNALTRYQEGYAIVPKLLRGDANADGFMGEIIHQNRRLYEWSLWPEVTGVDPERWLKARSNKERAAMAQEALHRVGHPDAAILDESLRSGKKYPPMPEEFSGWKGAKTAYGS